MGEMRASEVLLHPVRLRIAAALLDRSLTTGDLRDELPDVPAATLYRQVAALADGGVLEVVDEHRVRGAVERTYRLRDGAAYVGAEEARGMTSEDHRQAFLTFLLGLLVGFERYLGSAAPPDLERDLVGYRQAALHLTDDEARELLTELRAVLAPRLEQGPAQGRRRRIFATMLMPDDAG